MTETIKDINDWMTHRRNRDTLSTLLGKGQHPPRSVAPCPERENCPGSRPPIHPPAAAGPPGASRPTREELGEPARRRDGPGPRQRGPEERTGRRWSALVSAGSDAVGTLATPYLPAAAGPPEASRPTREGLGGPARAGGKPGPPPDEERGADWPTQAANEEPLELGADGGALGVERPQRRVARLADLLALSHLLLQPPLALELEVPGERSPRL